MKKIRLALAILMSSFVCVAAQPLTRPAILQWSKKAIVKSPDGQLQIEVHPILTDQDNHSPVVVHRRYDGREWALFTLSRVADVLWEADGNRILVIDEPTANDYDVHLYSSDGKRTELDTDGMIRSTVARLLGPDRKLEFYLPTFLSWEDADLVIAVGGASSTGMPLPMQSLPMKSFCFAVHVDSVSGRVLSANKLFSSRCRLSP